MYLLRRGLLLFGLAAAASLAAFAFTVTRRRVRRRHRALLDGKEPTQQPDICAAQARVVAPTPTHDADSMSTDPCDPSCRPVQRIRHIQIIFGTQTGTAEAFARDLRTRLVPIVSHCIVTNVADFDPDTTLVDDANSSSIALAETLFVFIMATHGEGDTTDSARDLFRWVSRKSHDSGVLAEVHYAVLGLGNSQYTQFNAAARRLDRHLHRLGATRICATGEGDDARDIEDDFDTWVNTHLGPALSARAVPQQREDTKPNDHAMSWTELDVSQAIKEHCHLESAGVASEGGYGSSLGDSPSSFAAATTEAKWLQQSVLLRVDAWRELRTGGPGSTKHVEFELQSARGLGTTSQPSTTPPSGAARC